MTKDERHGQRRARPFARRAFRTRRPFLVCMRARKPWVRLRRRLLGWNVRFMTIRLECLMLASRSAYHRRRAGGIYGLRTDKSKCFVQFSNRRRPTFTLSATYRLPVLTTKTGTQWLWITSCGRYRLDRLKRPQLPYLQPRSSSWIPTSGPNVFASSKVS